MLKVKIVLRHGTAAVFADKEAENVEVEIVGCDDCSATRWAEEIDIAQIQDDMNYHTLTNIRIAKDNKEETK